MILQSILKFPFVYSLAMNLLSGKSRSLYVRDYIRPAPKDKILDIGCGPADILSDLLDVDVNYHGFDENPKYILAAQKRFGNSGNFFCKEVAADDIQEANDFDIVLANGVLHHLDDNRALALFQLARHCLKSGGRLMTIDCCYVEKQSPVARFLISKDRGKYARTKNGYVDLASQVFDSVKVIMRDDLLRIPYTHIIMECVSK